MGTGSPPVTASLRLLVSCSDERADLSNALYIDATASMNVTRSFSICSSTLGPEKRAM